MRKTGWFLHKDHGYMYRGPVHEGWQAVVTALVLNAREVEENAFAWESHKSRLHVNGGCGAIAADAMQVGDHNPDFRPVATARVPPWIRTDFINYI